jgi:aspartyl protease family protein
VLKHYLIFAAGLIMVIVLLAPSLDKLPAGDSSPSGIGGGAPAGGVGLPMVAGPAAAAPQPAGGSSGGTFAIDRDSNGQFRVAAMVNDQPLRLLVDTGADGLALTEADARALGVAPDPAAYTQVATTASGPGYGAHVRIDRLEVGGSDLGGTDAVVIRGLGTSLLGQSLLRRMGQVTLSGDRMIIGN